MARASGVGSCSGRQLELGQLRSVHGVIHGALQRNLKILNRHEPLDAERREPSA
jgi:hypothetical protein